MEAIDLQFGFSRARDGLHFAVHRNLLNIFTPEWAKKHNVVSLRDEYAHFLKLEQEVHFRTPGYPNTSEIVAAKAQCDELFLFISAHIRTHTRNPNNAIREAAKQLHFILLPYKNMTRKNNPAALGAYHKFLSVMNGPELAADVMQLDLTEALASLQEALAVFDAEVDARAQAKLQRVDMPMREIRQQVDERFRAWATLVNALYCVNYYIDQDAEKEAELLEVIHRVNGVLVETGETLVRLGLAYKPVSKRKEKASAEEDKAEKEVTL